MISGLDTLHSCRLSSGVFLVALEHYPTIRRMLVMVSTPAASAPPQNTIIEQAMGHHRSAQGREEEKGTGLFLRCTGVLYFIPW